jgi:sRNA-binding carbon storage regulator CsrA
MLKLQRRAGDRIDFTLPNGEEMKIILTEVRPGKVGLAILAPLSVKVLRPDAKNKTAKVRSITNPPE